MPADLGEATSARAPRDGQADVVITCRLGAALMPTKPHLSAAPHLKVGELAKRSGVTVRTLHHYDAIGLLKPSARSDADYRLYTIDDVARLHGIQVLRQMGLSLEEIATVLGDGASRLPSIVARQMQVLEREIDRASSLHQRLALLQQKYADGGPHDSNDWLEALRSMAVWEKHFNVDEMKLIVGGWPSVQGQWQQLIDDVQSLMDAGASPSDTEVQTLALRWTSLLHFWLEGNTDLMKRWGRMCMREPGALTRQRPSEAMLRFMEMALQVRLAALRRHLTAEDIEQLRPIADAEWAALATDVAALIAQRLPPHAPEVQLLLARWGEMIDRSVGGNAALRDKIKRAYTSEPLLRDSSPLPQAARAYLIAAARAQP